VSFDPSSCGHTAGRIRYSDRYSDDEYEYRHVTLPKPFLKLFPKQFFRQDEEGKQDPSGTLRLLAEKEWRAIGISQSMGWEHYEVHGMSIATFFV
jgi:cyclin-dependent kinase regulatory subunit CKS1